MEIELGRAEIVEQKSEIHYEVIVNSKTVQVSRYVSFGEHISPEAETEIFQGKEMLTEDEFEEVIAFVEEQD